jgi:uncharacterized protein (DUF58 family)
MLLLIAAILELLGRLISSSGVTIAASMALGAIVGDAALIPRIDRLRISREVAARLTVGVPARVQLTISASGRRLLARRPVVVLDQPQGLPETRVVVPAIAAGETALATYDATPTDRGHWTDERNIVIEGFSPLGGFVRRRRLAHGRETWVHPAPAAPLRLPQPVAGQAVGPIATPRSGAGTEIFGVREWRTGDPSSSIHWRASAKRGHLVVLEREQPSNAALVVIASGPAPADSALEDVERAIARCASATVAALRSGQRIVLVSDSTPVVATTAMEILDWFAEATFDAEVGAGALGGAIRSAGVGATVVWLSADQPPPDLRRVAAASGVAALVTPIPRRHVSS